MVASCRIRTCRGSDGHDVDRDAPGAGPHGRAGRTRPCSIERRNAVANRRRRHQALLWTAGCGRDPCTGRSSRRRALRSGRTRDHRARRHVARRHRGAAGPTRSTTAIRTAVLRIVGHAGRHGGRWNRRSRAGRAGSGARLRARRPAADRRRSRAQVRWRSHEERRRLRRLAPARRVTRHPRRAARRVTQGAACRP